jgi:serine/threonine protein kinase
LIDRLLTFDPNKRITAEQALLHPWITDELKAVANTNLAPTIRKGFSSRGTLKSVVTAVALLRRLKEDSSSSEEEGGRKSTEVKDLEIQ